MIMKPQCSKCPTSCQRGDSKPSKPKAKYTQKSYLCSILLRVYFLFHPSKPAKPINPIKPRYSMLHPKYLKVLPPDSKLTLLDRLLYLSAAAKFLMLSARPPLAGVAITGGPLTRQPPGSATLPKVALFLSQLTRSRRRPATRCSMPLLVMALSFLAVPGKPP